MHLQLFPFCLLLLIFQYDILFYNNLIQIFLAANSGTGTVLQLKCYTSACFVFFLKYICESFQLSIFRNRLFVSQNKFGKFGKILGNFREITEVLGSLSLSTVLQDEHKIPSFLSREVEAGPVEISLQGHFCKDLLETLLLSLQYKGSSFQREREHAEEKRNFLRIYWEEFLKDTDRKQPEITAPKITAPRMSEVGQVIIVCSYQEEEKLWEKAESGSYSQLPSTELHRMMPERSL